MSTVTKDTTSDLSRTDIWSMSHLAILFQIYHHFMSHMTTAHMRETLTLSYNLRSRCHQSKWMTDVIFSYTVTLHSPLVWTILRYISILYYDTTITSILYTTVSSRSYLKIFFQPIREQIELTLYLNVNLLPSIMTGWIINSTLHFRQHLQISNWYSEIKIISVYTYRDFYPRKPS